MSVESWPPQDGKQFVHSDGFGALLLDVVSNLSDKYPKIDFTDATAIVFAWFDGKLAKNRRFINSRRFPTLSAFRAYVKQSVWNAGRLTERQRSRRSSVEAVSVDDSIAVVSLTAEERTALLDQADRLPYPHKDVFERAFFNEEDLSFIASVLGKSEDEIHQLYEEAIDMLMES